MLNLFILQMIIIKITGAQCRVMTKKYAKFEKDSLKNGRTDERTNGPILLCPKFYLGA